MAEKKITKKEMFERLLEIEAVKESTELTNFVKHEIELLDRKKEGSKLTKTQEQNLELMETLHKELEACGKAVTISEFQKIGEVAQTLSNQKISALFRLMDGKTVEKTVEKGKSYFRAK